MLIFNEVHAPHPAADDHPAAERINPFEFQPGIRHRLFGRGHGELDEPLAALDFLRAQVDRRIEAFDLSRNLRLQGAGIKTADPPDAASPRHERSPERLDIVADRCDGSYSCHNNSFHLR